MNAKRNSHGFQRATATFGQSANGIGDAGYVVLRLVTAAVCLFVLLVPVRQGLAQASLVPERPPQRVFGGGARSISLRWHNPGTEPVSLTLVARLYQASSATAALIGEDRWKTLEILPGQTVLESALVNLPAVRSDTRFLVEWVEAGANRVHGTSDVHVYPTNLLSELKVLAGGLSLGVYEPQDELKPLLLTSGIEFDDMQVHGVEHFSGRLAIVGTFKAHHQIPAGLPSALRTLARRGVAVVWLLPPKPDSDELEPDFYSICEGKGTIVVALPVLVSGLAENPQAQIHLLQLCRLAAHPQPPRFPLLTAQP